MFDLGKETPITVDGKPWIIGRLTVNVIEGFRDWIVEREGDPFAWLKDLAAILPQQDVKQLLADAVAVRQQLAAFTMACPLAKRYFATEIGAGKLYQLLLHARHPEATVADGFRVFLADAGAALSKGSGDVPGNVPAPAA